MRKIDLHCHTTASDGLLTPTELVERAKATNAGVIAVTDHDTTAGIAEASAAGERDGVRVVSGIELSTRDGSRNVHMLGYFVDAASPRLERKLEDLRADRIHRAERMVQRLNELGYELGYEEVRALAGGGSVGRPHVARALVSRGYLGGVGDAFTPELIADGGKADVGKQAVSSVAAIELIGSAGGVAVIAHAAVSHHDGPERSVPYELIEKLAARGMAGVETDHPDHPPLVREELERLARRLGLVCTGGSDFHGERRHRIGTCTTSPEAMAELEARRASP